jgi:hypothetical protein
MSANRNYNILTQYLDKYGYLPSGDEPLLFNITGPFRDAEYERDRHRFRTALIQSLLILCLTVVFPSWFILSLTVFGMVCLNYYVYSPASLYNGSFVNINGRQIGVLVQTPRQEGQRESNNFKEKNDRKRLWAAGKLPKGAKVAVVSVGSSSSQGIDGIEYMKRTEFNVGVNNPENIAEMLDAIHMECEHLYIINSAGYALDLSKGIVSASNSRGEDDISPSIVHRSVNGTGDNKSAMAFYNALVRLYKAGGYKFTLGGIPRGDDTLPQGGSHSKDLMVDAIRKTNGRPIKVIEVSGMQSKEYSIEDDHELENYSTESLCKRIKEKKIVATDGKSYGSAVVFGK